MVKKQIHHIWSELKKAIERDQIICYIIIGLSLFRLAHQALKFIRESPFIDLAYHYFYSTMTRLGLDPFDPSAIEKAKIINPIRFAGGEAVYSPSYFLFFQPLTYIPFCLLQSLWLISCLVLVFFSIVCLLWNKEGDRSLLQLTFVILIVALYQPLYEDLALGQNNCLILVLAVGTWYGFKHNLQWLSGFCVAAMALIKIQFGFILLCTLMLGKKRVFLISSLFFLALFTAGLPKLGVAHYQKYLFAVLRHTSVVASDLQNISINGMLNRLLSDNGQLAFFFYLLISIFLFISLLIWFHRYKIKDHFEIAFLACLTMIPLVSPHTEEHHLVIIILPLLYVALNFEKLTLRDGLLYFCSVVLVVSRYSWIKFASSSNIWLMPLLSLKTLGVLLLLIVIMSTAINQVSRFEKRHIM